MAKIIYIAGAGRSGSTLLSLLLSQHPDVTNLGQIRDVFFAAKRGARCSCGARLTDCDFWGGIVRSGEVANGRRLAALAPEMLARVYAQALHQAGTPWVVDSSKSADLCEMLVHASHKVMVLNLMRDPRAVAASWSRDLPQPVLRRRMRNWCARQRRIEGMSGSEMMSLRYEDLVDHPQEVLAKIWNWAGIVPNFDCFASSHTAQIEWADQHLFPPTNARMLSAQQSLITIKPPQDWRRPDFVQARTLATELCFPFAERYGYGRQVAR